jgi:hypothetical protein
MGMMGLAVLIGIFGYWAFFPLSKFQFWTFVLAGPCCLTWLAPCSGPSYWPVSVALHGWLWITVRFHF